MKILYDNFIFELQYAGGISKVWFNLIKHFKANTQINLFFVEGNNVNNLFRKNLQLNTENIIKDKNFSKNVRRFLGVSNNSCDIYHSSYFRPLKNKGKSKVVVTVHDFIYEKYSGYLPKKIHLFLKNRALKQADAVICVSNHTKLDFYKYYPKVNPAIVHTVHNGVDGLFKPIIKLENIELGGYTYQRNKYLLYVGNRGFCKNFNFVLKLMHSKIVQKEQFKLICIGGGMPSLKEKAEIKALNLQDEINFQSGITSDQLNNLYNHAFCLLFPSIYEGFGIPAVESMKSGCPVWSTNSSSVKELLGEAYPVSFNPENWNEALDCFMQLCNPIIRDSAINEGLKQAKKFSWSNCAEETNKVYNKLLNA